MVKLKNRTFYVKIAVAKFLATFDKIGLHFTYTSGHTGHVDRPFRPHSHESSPQNVIPTQN